MRIYLDTSAYLLRFSDEPPQSYLVNEIFDKCEQGKLTIVTSFWTISECIAALDQAFTKKGRISRHERNALISSLLGKTIDMSKQKHLVLIEPNEKMIYTSWSIIRRRHLSADDALHAFTAKVGQCDLFVLADDYFARRMKEEGEIEEEDLTESEQFSFGVTAKINNVWKLSRTLTYTHFSDFKGCHIHR